MSRRPDPELEPVPDPPGPAGAVGPTVPGLLAGLVLLGLVGGRLIRPVSISLGLPTPALGWLPALGLVLLAFLVGWVAWVTHRALHTRGERLEAHRAVNRLVLAKACAVTGALAAGAYAGYALAWAGDLDTPLGQQRVIRAAVASLASAGVVAGSLLLERACRVRTGPGGRGGARTDG